MRSQRMKRKRETSQEGETNERVLSLSLEKKVKKPKLFFLSINTRSITASIPRETRQYRMKVQQHCSLLISKKSLLISLFRFPFSHFKVSISHSIFYLRNEQKTVPNYNSCIDSKQSTKELSFLFANICVTTPTYCLSLLLSLYTFNCTYL